MNTTRTSRRRAALKPLLIALGAAALTACAVGPDYRTPPLPAAQAVADIGLDTAFYSADAPPAQFWSSFGDAGLDALEARALAADHDLRIALASLNQARTLRREAFLDYLPTVTAGAGYAVAQQSADRAPGYSRDDRHSELYDAGFDAAWELDLFGRVRRLNEASRANEEALAADQRAAQLSVAAEVARTYFELRGAQARLSVAERNADKQLGTPNHTEARLAYGRGTELDRERARAQLAATRARVSDLRTAVANAEHRLAVLGGLAASALRDELDVPQALPPLPRLLQIGEPQALLRRRPDVASAERQLAAASAGNGVAVADYCPRVSFTGEAGFPVAHLGSVSDGVGDGGSDRYAFGPSISWAAFDLGRVQTRVAQRRAGADAALARHEQSVLRALEETANTLVGYGQNHRRKLDLLDAGAQASERAVQLARVRFEAGAVDFIDVPGAERSLLGAGDQQAQARTQTATSLVALYKSLGGGRQGAAPQTLSRKG